MNTTIETLRYNNAIDKASRLSQVHFMQMMGLAVVFHIVAGIVWSFLPHDESLNVPVHVLNIKLGNSEGITGVPLLGSHPETAVAVSEALQPTVVEAEAVSNPVSPSVVESLDASLEKPEKKAPPPVPINPQKSQAQKAVQAVQKSWESQNAANAASTGKRGVKYVREGSIYGNSNDGAAEILARYEQLISSWIQRFKIVSDDIKGLEGKAVVRIRIDRQGRIKYAAIERSTGNKALDQAVSQMIREANPVPAVPADYPAGRLLEFLVPVTFEQK